MGFQTFIFCSKVSSKCGKCCFRDPKFKIIPGGTSPRTPRNVSSHLACRPKIGKSGPAASRKLIWLKVWTTNSNPLFVGKWYLQSLLETGILPNYIRLDKGTETTTMSTIQVYLRSQQGDLEDPTDSILFGSSPSNQVCTPKILILFFIYI